MFDAFLCTQMREADGQCVGRIGTWRFDQA
jgi:hypothetical protein